MAMDEFDSETMPIIGHLTAALQNAGMYPGSHPQVRSRIREAFDSLEVRLRKRHRISFLRIGDNLIVDNKPLNIAGSSATAFLRFLKKNGIERMTFMEGLSIAELEDFTCKLASSDEAAIPSSRHIEAGKLELEGGNEGRTEHGAGADVYDGGVLEIADPLPEQPNGLVRTLYRNVGDNNPIDIELVDETVRQFMNRLRTETDPLRLLSEVKTNDEYTFVHTANVGILTMFIAESMGFSGPMIKEIGVAAVLHDVGKVMIPDCIISKPGALSPEERTVMETHPIKGALHLMDMKSTRTLPALVALEHHVRYDGGGYPRLPDGHKPNIISQILSVADVFDALRTTRPYRNSMPIDEVIEVIRKGSGSSFNPYIVEQFLDLIKGNKAP